jgi:hypothetical protein
MLEVLTYAGYVLSILLSVWLTYIFYKGYHFVYRNEEGKQVRTIWAWLLSVCVFSIFVEDGIEFVDLLVMLFQK